MNSTGGVVLCVVIHLLQMPSYPSQIMCVKVFKERGYVMYKLSVFTTSCRLSREYYGIECHGLLASCQCYEKYLTPLLMTNVFSHHCYCQKYWQFNLNTVLCQDTCTICIHAHSYTSSVCVCVCVLCSIVYKREWSTV